MSQETSQTTSKRFGTTVKPSRTLAMRRAQLGVTVTALSKASGMSKQHLAQVISERRSVSLPMIRRMSMLLHCPPDLLIAEDPVAAIGYPLPPSDWLQTIQNNREYLGFNDLLKVPAFSAYEAIVYAKPL